MMSKKWMRGLVVSVVLLWAAVAGAATTLTADQALSQLMAGNANFVKGKVPHLASMSTVAVRQSVAAGQSPYAIILACSDSRVPPELLFDRGLGEIFIIRVAGNVVAPHELGSIEYALEHLGVPLIMVLGHERCGAVTAAADWAGEVLPENIYSIINSILPAVYAVQAKHTYATHDEYVDQCIVENIKLVTKQLTTDSPLIKEFFELGKAKIVKAKYDLDDGKVRLIQ